MHCHLFIPDFRENVDGEARVAAETLVARGRRRKLPAIARERWLFERFGVERRRDWPVAPYTLLADGVAPGERYWMRADPVHLNVGGDTLALDGAAVGLSREEAEALAATLNRHFGEALSIHAPHPERWYAAFREAPDLETSPPGASGAIGELLPRGAEAMRFRALLNEVQMLLHEHPVNTEREARGAPAVNSVWFWGGGGLEAPRGRPFSVVIAEDPLARGLAMAAGVPGRRLPQDAEAALFSLPETGKTLIVLDAPSVALERDWFAPLLAALKAGRIGMLSVYLSAADGLLAVETVRSDLRHFWRMRKPLQAWLA